LAAVLAGAPARVAQGDSPRRAEDLATVAVNEYFGMKYEQEPVSFDLALPAPAPADTIRLAGAPTQVEVLEGTPEAARRVRLWTLVDFDQPGQRLFKVEAGARRAAAPEAAKIEDAGECGGVRLARIANAAGFAAKVPVASATFDPPASAFDLPGPVVSVSADGGKTWRGSGYLDTIRRVRAVQCTVSRGPVFIESRITYRFEGDRTYAARVRIFPNKPYAQLVEDFDLGGTAKFIFNYDDWAPPYFIGCSDSAQTKLYDVAKGAADDFIRIEGQRCLVRMTVWTQHGYFRDKTETAGLCEEDGSLAVGGFFERPDRWTRAKTNHVDLYVRPEVPGDRRTRGIVGLGGAQERIALEAWLIEGHREWAIFAMPAGEWKAPPAGPAAGPPPQGSGVRGLGVGGEFQWNPVLQKAHVVEGVWPLDRLNRLPLVWNADGSPVRLEDARPCGGLGFAGDIASVLKSTRGRGGLQHFNGSNPSMRGGYAKQAQAVVEWAGANHDKRSAAALQALGKLGDYMVGPAMAATMAMDDSAYPGVRAMLPWSDPEALNPFYQGMENMNFNIDRYTSVLAAARALEAMGHPEARPFVAYCRRQLEMDLDRYVYPQSGCWEESLGYAGSILRASLELGREFRDRREGDYFADPRVINAYGFWTKVLSPPDAGFGGARIVPAIGDHGINLPVHIARIQSAIPDFLAAPNDQARRLARQLAWSLAERKADVPPGVEPEKPNLSSRWLQGYGSVLRAAAADGRESFVVVRAGQSWGHHHQDKGSLWGWFRSVHFFGDAAWGSPPGGTYWNPYKQGPASGTQIEFVGVNNWPLPCKYPAPWIADEDYAPDSDYALARCLYPYNPALDLSRSSPAALRNGYDRQVLLVHPDLLIVRDNVETTCPTIWRMHSYQPDGTTVGPGRATLASPQGVTGTLAMLYPEGVKFSTSAVHDLPLSDGKIINEPFGHKAGEGGGKKGPSYDTRSVVLRWDMPPDSSATWVFAVHDRGEKAPAAERLDDRGRVTRVVLSDGREVIAMMSIEPFAWQGRGIDFAGTVGLVVRAGRKTARHAIRATRLEAE
jgi:hypothetical protein